MINPTVGCAKEQQCSFYFNFKFGLTYLALTN